LFSHFFERFFLVELVEYRGYRGGGWPPRRGARGQAGGMI
jgi:hypothetical protein